MARPISWLQSVTLPGLTIAVAITLLCLTISQSEAGTVDWPGGTLAAYDFNVSQSTAHVDGTFTVSEFRTYVVSLRFFYKGNVDLNRVLALVGRGSSSVHTGYIVPVHVEILEREKGSDEEHTIVNRVVQTKSSFVHAFTPSDFNSGAIGREIMTINLQPGSYEIRANAVQDSSVFSDVPCQIAIEAHPNLQFLPATK